MKTTHAVVMLLAVALAGASAACKKDDDAKAKDDHKAAKPDEASAEDEAAAKTGPDEQPVEEPEDKTAAGGVTAEGTIKILAGHSKPKPDDPVEVSFPAFEVVSADFDPQNLEGASAEIHVDLTKLESGSDKRDDHLRSEDYLDVGKFGVAKVLVSDVARGEGEGMYDATARVTVHGVEVEWPVTFEVVETMENGVKVRASHEFQRKDFGVGADEGDSVAQDLELRLELALTKG